MVYKLLGARRDHERGGGLALLLPATSRGCSTNGDGLEYARNLWTTISRILSQDRSTTVVCGMDESDPALRHFCHHLTEASCSQRVILHVFTAAELVAAQSRTYAALGANENTVVPDDTAPICWIRGELARLAVQKHQAKHVILLGDDTAVSPINWMQKVSGWAICIVLPALLSLSPIW